jgi:hypothetical protein
MVLINSTVDGDNGYSRQKDLTGKDDDIEEKYRQLIY